LLECGRYGERGQQQHENEQIVHRERLLDYISGEVLGASFTAEPGPDECTEGQRNRDIEDRPPGGLTGGDSVRPASEQEVADHQNDDEADRQTPEQGGTDGRLIHCE
jgi:hypothetical protein